MASPRVLQVNKIRLGGFGRDFMTGKSEYLIPRSMLSRQLTGLGEIESRSIHFLEGTPYQPGRELQNQNVQLELSIITQFSQARQADKVYTSTVLLR